MPSFDVVSKLTMNEVDNALNQANKELGQRFDFRGSNTAIKLVEQVMTVESADEFLPSARYLIASQLRAKPSPWYGGKFYVDLLRPVRHREIPVDHDGRLQAGDRR